jgi:hypothetical protein
MVDREESTGAAGDVEDFKEGVVASRIGLVENEGLV